MDGHLSLFILEICPYHFIFLFRTVFSAISCPVLTRTSALLTLSAYLMRSIRRNHRFSHAFSLLSMAVVKLQVSLPYSRIGITAALSSLSFIARLISCLLKTFSLICEMLLLQKQCASSCRPPTTLHTLLTTKKYSILNHFNIAIFRCCLL